MVLSIQSFFLVDDRICYFCRFSLDYLFNKYFLFTFIILLSFGLSGLIMAMGVYVGLMSLDFAYRYTVERFNVSINISITPYEDTTFCICISFSKLRIDRDLL